MKIDLVKAKINSEVPNKLVQIQKTRTGAGKVAQSLFTKGYLK
ncbi:hypothetical protein GLIP_0727 [Aliiglaciecola lipolytica E3]|uniref:Uncharacterized protein n=1 Tax=Aliiglaciecola lipolytica E3 TaxID=1127673 RepID=K6Y9Q3_9ALTE|nr:hypothetical protein GLIP_0727 [Aliiglaciecola lipolytica E3]